jgi:hypothetical protein
MSLSFAALQSLISGLFRGVIGSNILLGIIILVAFVVLAVFSGAELSVGLVILVPLLFLLVAAGLLPNWVIMFVAFGVGIIIYMAYRSQVERG